MPTPAIHPDVLAKLLQEVQKPARYIGGEVNAVVKDPEKVKLKVALVFPDVYEMGESHVGLKVLYKILNSHPEIWAERVYAPLPDMEAALRKHDIPLFSLESRRPLHDFDLIGITLPYELVYTNILTVLQLGGVPLWQKDRERQHPIVLGGGTCAFNPEPIAEWFDAIVVGDGEDLILKIAEKMLADRDSEKSRQDFLSEMTEWPGLYVPSLFDVDYFEDGRVQAIRPLNPGYPGVEKATVTNLDAAAYPTAPIVPHVNVIHDRVGVEVQRGCVRGCRFCQAGYIYRPERQRSPDTVKAIIDESLKNTGYEEVSLLSLSVGDYEPLSPLLNELFDRYEKDRVAISLPATRTETLTPEVIRQIKRVRKTGFTLAPEAGTPRMRRVINKGNAREDLMKTVDNVFREGWKLIKFYYMCGLPFEHDEDLLGIAEEAVQALAIGKGYSGNPKINVSVSSFVPKPFTPFQWEPQLSVAEVEAKHQLLRKALNQRGLNFKHHNSEMSYLEGVFSRGDRRLSQVVVRAYELGCRFDEWDEHLDFAKWLQAFADVGLDPDFYVSRPRDFEELFPWDHLFTQMKKDFLWKERGAAHDEAFMEDCSTHRCTHCGVCDFHEVKNINYQYSESGAVQAHSTRRRPLKTVPEQVLNPVSSEIGGLEEFETQTKLRVQYTKLGEAAYLSHLDLMTLLRRALARAKIPVGFSKGFHPQMLLSMGPAQALGVESRAEYFDIELLENVSPEDFSRRLNEALPTGIQILDVAEISKKTPSLNGTLREQAYEIEFLDAAAEGFSSDLRSRMEGLQNAAELKFERRKESRSKVVDLRPFIKDLELLAPNRIRLVTKFGQTEGSVKPSEVLSLLYPQGDAPHRICKTEAIFAP